MDRTFRLCLDVVVVRGFERFPFGTGGKYIHAVSDKVINELIDGIIAGNEFDPVILERDFVDELAFRLSWAYNKSKNVWEGGHTRAIAHYIAGVPLLCRMKNVSDYELIPVPAPPFIPISEYQIIDDAVFSRKGIGLERRREIWQKE